MGEAACICCASGSGVAQEEVWGLRHPDAGAGFEVRIQGSEGVERWGRWVKKGGQGVCVGNGGDAVSCLDGRSDNFTDNCGLVVVGCWCSEVVGAFGMLKPDVFSGARCGV